MSLPVRILLVVAAVVATLAPAAAPSGAVPSSVKISVSKTPLATSRLELGVTHTQYSVDPWGDGAAVASARSLLSSAPFHQNQHIMGWGALNPEPRPGEYDFATLDGRVRLMLETSTTPTITFAGAPDWMKGGVAGVTDWAKLEVAPLPEFYDEFARLASVVAARYPDVRRFQVWNELKGFHDPVTNRWNATAYTNLYNEVYDAVKAVRPDALIGGPYVAMDSWASRSAGGFPSDVEGEWGIVDGRALDVITYWLTNKHGADFLSIDGGSATRDKGLVASPFVAAEKFAAVTNWVRQRTTLPVVWSEWYPVASSGDTTHQSAVLAHALATTAVAGASAVLMWQPQCVAPKIHSCLFTDSRVVGGGQPTRLYDTAMGFANAFPAGAIFLRAKSSSPAVTALATDSMLMLVNTTSSIVRINGVRGVSSLSPHQVRLVAR